MSGIEIFTGIIPLETGAISGSAGVLGVSLWVYVSEGVIVDSAAGRFPDVRAKVKIAMARTEKMMIFMSFLIGNLNHLT